MIRHFLFCAVLSSALVTLAFCAQPAGSNSGVNLDRASQNWDWRYNSDEGGGGSSFLGVDIADVSADRLAELKLKEEHGAEIVMVDKDAPAGKAELHEHDVILSLNGTAIESAAQLRRMIKETPPGRVVALGISRDGQPMTVKVQLADRQKSMEWEPNVKVSVPKIDIPPMDFDLPVSMVAVQQLGRSGLLVEDITPQLGDYFGVKGGKGVLVRSVEKGSRGEKAGFRAGDVVVKVNNQPVHDASDFTHAVRSSSGNSAAVTILREKKEQNLTLPLPQRKDSGSLLEDSFEVPEFSAETERAMNRAGAAMARMAPAFLEKWQQEESRWQSDIEKKLEDSQRKLQDKRKEMQDREQKLSHELSGLWTEI
ncbi:MAG: PDZ domain-containing protein [Terriglobales bacterium]